MHIAGSESEDAPCTGGRVEIAVREALTTRTAAPLCRAVQEVGASGPQHVWLNLEDVKVSDAVGLAALVQSVRVLERRAIRTSVLPSAPVYRALLDAAVVDELPLEPQGVMPAAGLAIDVGGLDSGTPPLLAATARLGIRPPRWDELTMFEQWAREPLLDQMVGSDLLYLCRHLGPFHPDFVARTLHNATSITLFVESLETHRPTGFVRLYNIHLVEGFGFLETVIADARALRKGFGVEASRLALAWGMDTMDLRRVEAKAFAYNTLSINALRRNGFHQEGVLRQARTYEGQRWDIFVFAILEDDMRRERMHEGYPHMGFWPVAVP
jgi:RimJ/RimL family protein N-acetyltransferase/anti-anti-sigma regulatory factor